MTAFVAQLGERKTEDLKVRGSIPRGGIFLFYQSHSNILPFMLFYKEMMLWW